MRKSECESETLEGDISDNRYEALHKSVLSGFISNIAQKKDKNFFRAGRGREVMIFPGSGIFDKAKSWVVAAEVVETSRVFARTVANIDDGWLEDIGRDLCKYTYLNPHWEKNRGEVVASEQVSLFGLIIVPERKVSYGKINAEEASDIFIRSALIEGAGWWAEAFAAAGFPGAFFRPFHGAENGYDSDDDQGYDNGRDPAVEIVGNGLDEDVDAGTLRGHPILFQQSGEIDRPGGDGNDQADRCGGGVHHVGQHLPGGAVLVSDVLHR